MRKCKKSVILSIGQIIFWLIILYVFTTNSFLRPFCMQNPYKEFIVVTFIVIYVYFHYFILIPRLFLKGKFLLFFSLAFLFTLLIAGCELFLVESDIRHCCKFLIENEKFSSYLMSLFGLITLRNLSFFIFFFLFRIYQNIAELLIIKQKTFAEKMKQIGISISANKEVLVAIKDITHIECERNKTTVYLINGKSYAQYCSLTDMEEILPKEFCLRVNRSTIIMYKYVVSFTDMMVTISTDKEGNLKSYKISVGEKEKVFQFLNKYFSNRFKGKVEKKIKKKEEKKEKAIKFGVKKDNIFGVTKKTAPLLEEIHRNPGQNASSLSSHFPTITKRTIENYIRELKELDLIIYKGSARKGGYFPKKS